MIAGRPRYSRRALPPYSYVPGHAPHPVSDPAGHMHGQPHDEAAPLRPDAWEACEAYRFGVDLFNHGYYWEAHEAWESVWIAVGRTGRVADFLKGLIKLAAGGVKAREGNPRGVERHAKRAVELLTGEAGSTYCGLAVNQIIGCAHSLGRAAESYGRAQPELLLDIVLQLDEV